MAAYKDELQFCILPALLCDRCMAIDTSLACSTMIYKGIPPQSRIVIYIFCQKCRQCHLEAWAHVGKSSKRQRLDGMRVMLGKIVQDLARPSPHDHQTEKTACNVQLIVHVTSIGGRLECAVSNTLCVAPEKD